MLTLCSKLGPGHYGTCGALLNGPDCGATARPLRPPTSFESDCQDLDFWDREKSYLPSLRARRRATPGARSYCALRIPVPFAEKPGSRGPRRLADVSENVNQDTRVVRSTKNLPSFPSAPSEAGSADGISPRVTSGTAGKPPSLRLGCCLDGSRFIAALRRKAPAYSPSG